MSDRLRAMIEADPQAAHKYMRAVAAQMVVPHSGGQQEVLDAKERFLVLCAGRRWGKAIPLDEPVLTPRGWVPNGSLSVGDHVVGSDGKSTRVLGVYPQGKRPTWRVTFSDGAQVRCDSEHLWTVYNKHGYAKTATLATLAEDYLVERPGYLERRYAVPLVAPVEMQPIDLPVHPYVLGALLGDGSLVSFVQFTTTDREIIDRVGDLTGIVPTRYSETSWGLTTPRGQPNPLLEAIRGMGLIGTRSSTKWVPRAYLDAPVGDRLELLRGLLDTDGSVSIRRPWEIRFTSTSHDLATAVQELIRSLGGLASIRWAKGATVERQDTWAVRGSMPTGLNPCYMRRKADRWRPAPRFTRKIAKIERVGTDEMQCIEVAADDGLYVTSNHVLTHNTKIAAKRSLATARRSNKMIWYVAPTYRIVKRGYREVLRQLPPGVLAKPAPPDTSFDAGRSVALVFTNGTRMEFYSAERPEGMLGEGVDLAILDEAATMPENVWTQIVRPTLADRSGHAIFISTPRGRNWFYQIYERGQDPLEPDYMSWQFPSWTNPTIPAAEWEAARKDTPQLIFDQEYAAEFVSAAASVFAYDPKAIVPMVDPLGHVTMGIDLAKARDFTVLDAVRNSDRMPCYHDRFNQVRWAAQQGLIENAVDHLLESGATGVTLAVDSTGVGDPIVEALEDLGFDVVGVKFSNQWKQKAVTLLGSDLEQGAAFIHEDQRKEIDAYGYTITDGGRWKFEALTGHDDEVSAKLLQHWVIVHEGVPDARGLGGDDGGELPDVAEDAEVVTVRSTVDLMNDPAMWG